jgi:hypothetical protein
MNGNEPSPEAIRAAALAAAPTREAAPEDCDAAMDAAGDRGLEPPIAQGEQGGAITRDEMQALDRASEQCSRKFDSPLLTSLHEKLIAIRQQPAAPSPAEPVTVSEGVACPICDGTGRVDSVSKCCGPPRHLDEPQLCNRPPQGWYCGLARGHEGSCPAWPVSHETAAITAAKAAQPESEPTKRESLVRDLRAIRQRAIKNGMGLMSIDEINAELEHPADAAPGAAEEAIAHLHPIVSFAMSRGVQAPYDCLAVITAALAKPDGPRVGGEDA